MKVIAREAGRGQIVLNEMDIHVTTVVLLDSQAESHYHAHTPSITVSIAGLPPLPEPPSPPLGEEPLPIALQNLPKDAGGVLQCWPEMVRNMPRENCSAESTTRATPRTL